MATTGRSVFRRMLAFAGPAYLVSVGYMDPGNWATDLAGGSRFGYQLVWVLVLSNAMAILLQTLSARLGIVAGKDLAQACREAYPRAVSNALWALCEVAIAACDLAEVLGAAIGLKLLFGIPLLYGVLLTALDTVLVLWLTRYGIRLVEAIILSLILLMTACFLIELGFARPAIGAVVSGLAPRLNRESLYVAIGILGATVMPHNLYLHSALVQTRRIGTTVSQKAEACKFNFLDSLLALNGALLVNGAILVLAAAVFYRHGTEVTRIEQAHELLTPLLGTGVASALFAIALLASGQSSTLTGTYAGQIVMEGFLDLRLRPWLRRLLTRSVAIIPAVFTVAASGDEGTLSLLILSQVILSMQLPFAVIPLIRFTSDRGLMGEFVNRTWVKALAWSMAALILVLNFWLAGQDVLPWIFASAWRMAWGIPVLAALIALLGWVAFAPRKQGAGTARLGANVGEEAAAELGEPVYKRILVPLDHSSRDRAAIAHAASMARIHKAVIHLLHVEEGAISQLYGALASTAEEQKGEQYFRDIQTSLERQGLAVELTVVPGRSPRDEIVRVARETKPDLVVMGAHGHSGIKDLVFGNTINGVRHAVAASVLVVGESAGRS